MSYWRTVSSIDEVEDRPGVYVLIHGGRALYVGQSTDVKTRLGRWKITSEGVRISWGAATRLVSPIDLLFLDAPPMFYSGAVVKVKAARRFGDWLMDEARLIKKLRPKWNIRMYKRAQRLHQCQMTQAEIDKQTSRISADIDQQLTSRNLQVIEKPEG